MLATNNLKQQGYILLGLLLIVFLAGSFALLKNQTKNYKQASEIQQRLKALKGIKQRLLIHAQQVPQLYATNADKKFFESSRIDPPGYLPCPNTDLKPEAKANVPCGRGMPYAHGRIPLAYRTRHFEILNNRALLPYIWYVVDSRYVTENNDYTESNNIFKFAPLNPNNPAKANLEFNQLDNLVALLIWPLDKEEITDLDSFSLDKFTNQNSLVVTITHQEWVESITQVIEPQKEYLCQLDASAKHWFNNCTRRTDRQTGCQILDKSQQDETNPLGSNWREILCDANQDLP